MMPDSASRTADSERAELEIVVAALERSPRLAKLLNFLAERYFRKNVDEITEYNIATEVFGRAKTAFDSTDSVARVEMYRLRKWLKEYYEAEGRDHAVKIVIPFRTYAPEFVRQDVSSQAPGTSPAQSDALELESQPAELVLEGEDVRLRAEMDAAETGHAGLTTRWARILIYAAVALAMLLVVSFGAVRFFTRTPPAHSAEATKAHAPAIDQTPTPANAAHVPLRLLAGYSGTPRIDTAGVYWEADRYFHGGAAYRRLDPAPAKTSDPMLYEYWRTGDFTYDIPLGPGPYELHLFFVASPQDDFNTTFFDAIVNGQTLLPAFNINSDALGANVADERVFKDIFPDRDGFLHLKFTMGRSGPTLNALEILPGLPHKQLPVRLVMQRAAVTDHSGNLWRPDTYSQGGTLSAPPKQVSGTPDPNLYSQERYGHFAYSIPVDTRSRYTLVLHFAELYWVPDSSGSVGVGSRVFQVYCNGSTLLDHFDIFKEAGSLHALTKTFHHLRPSPEGKLDLTFEPITNFATVSAIELIDESE